MITLNEHLDLKQNFEILKGFIVAYCDYKKYALEKGELKDKFIAQIVVKPGCVDHLPNGISLAAALFTTMVYLERIGLLTAANFQKLMDHPNFEDLYQAVSRAPFTMKHVTEDATHIHSYQSYQRLSQTQLNTMMTTAETAPLPEPKPASIETTPPSEIQPPPTEAAPLPSTSTSTSTSTSASHLSETTKQHLLSDLHKYAYSWSHRKHHKADVTTILSGEGTIDEKITRVLQIGRLPNKGLDKILASYGLTASPYTLTEGISLALTTEQQSQT